MKRTLYFAAVALAMILIAPTIYGQSDQPKLRFHIPFQFSINSETFTPGDYVVIQKSTFLLKVANLNSSSAAFESVYPAQSRKEANGQVRLDLPSLWQPVFPRHGVRRIMAVNVRFQDFHRRKALGADECSKADDDSKRQPGRDCTSCSRKPKLNLERCALARCLREKRANLRVRLFCCTPRMFGS